MTFYVIVGGVHFGYEKGDAHGYRSQKRSKRRDLMFSTLVSHRD